MPKEKKEFSIQPDEDGYFFATKDEKDLGIRTKKYDNGSEIKEVVLKNGRTAVIRKLRGRDFVETKKKIQGDDSLDFETTNMSVAVTFDGDKKEPPEYFLDNLFQDDYSTLMVAYGALNFQ